MLKKLLTPKWILTTLLVLAAIAVLARLGIWQLDRLELRRAFNAHYLAVMAMPPLEISAAPAEDLSAMEYRAATVTGVYDYEHQIALRNRYYGNVYGYHLLTPLILSDGSAILVERGWIPASGNETSADWRKYDQPGQITLSGILRLGQEPEMGGVPDPELVEGQTRLEFWNNVNLARIASQTPTPLLPVFFQPEYDPADSQPPIIPARAEIEISEGPHFGYAMQWFTFAIMLALGYPFFLRKQLSERK
ncbi:MAG: SURF1 family protein [Chloroflexi bacterium HGW-Chloroflexi-6]|nr:MAG: SURF1 family protein [Chloroflexi bacterium HGW-Chloroflexi-6]